MPLQPESVYLLTSVPSEIYVPVAAAMGSTIVAMGKVITTLYNNERQSHIDSLTALKDATHAIEKLTGSSERVMSVVEKIYDDTRTERAKRAANG